MTENAERTHVAFVEDEEGIRPTLAALEPRVPRTCRVGHLSSSIRPAGNTLHKPIAMKSSNEPAPLSNGALEKFV
jgi:hypothetical protein